jgi:molybdate transport system permease protein
VLPVVALLFGASPAAVWAGVRHPLFAPALLLSARTTVLSTALVVLGGTPLAWWLATSSPRRARPIETLVDVPIVLPPAVLGVALLQAFGRQGLLGPALSAVGIGIPFTTAAVVIAQIVVSAPFYVQAATAAFRGVDVDLLIVARTLGASPAAAFFRVAIPLALPGLVAGAAMSWARAVGEFGATLLFAGSREGVTRTMPLAIFHAFEADVRVAVALALVLAGASVVLLFGLRYLPGAERRRGAGERWRHKR